MDIRKQKKEILLIIFILFIACILLLVNRIVFSKPARQVEISVNGEVIKTLSLNQDREILVNGYKGGTNRVVIKDQKVHISEATCPDKLCIHQGWIEHTGESLVCLPNRVIVRIIGE